MWTFENLSSSEQDLSSDSFPSVHQSNNPAPQSAFQGRTQHSSKVANEPPSKNQPAFFFLFLLSPTEACFLTKESKANVFDRRSFATLELKLRSCRRTATAADGLGGVRFGRVIDIAISIAKGCERDAQGIAVRVVEAMWCSIAIRAATSEKKRAVFECLGAGGRL